MAKKRPPMSLELANAKSASEVAEIIGNSWIGYGLESVEDENGDTATVVLTTLPKTWATAQEALWFKVKGTKDNSTLYRMYNMNYELYVTRAGETKSEKPIKHTILIRPVTEIATKELADIVHLLRH